jgi:hypothetical protein
LMLRAAMESWLTVSGEMTPSRRASSSIWDKICARTLKREHMLMGSGITLRPESAGI